MRRAERKTKRTTNEYENDFEERWTEWFGEWKRGERGWVVPRSPLGRFEWPAGFQRSAPVLGRSDVRIRYMLEIIERPRHAERCCARGRAHSGDLPGPP